MKIDTNLEPNAVKLEFGFGVGQTREGNPISMAMRTRALGLIRDEACRLFGGCTLVETQGAWRNNAGKVFNEPGFTLFVFVEGDATTALRLAQKKIETLVSSIKTMLDQEAVYFSAHLIKTQLL